MTRTIRCRGRVRRWRAGAALLLACCGSVVARTQPSPAVVASAPPPALLAALRKLDTSAAVRGTLEVTQSTSQGEGAKARRSEAGASVRLAAARGIRLHVPGSELAQARAQLAAQRADPQRTAALADLLAGLGVAQAQRMVDAAADLRLLLQDATLQQRQATLLDGRPATLLRLRIPLRVAKADRDKVKKYRDDLSLWLDAHGVPIAFTRLTFTEIGWFVLNVRTTRSESARLAVVDGRLLVTVLDIAQDASGLGQHGATRTRYRFVARPAARARAARPAVAHSAGAAAARTAGHGRRRSAAALDRRCGRTVRGRACGRATPSPETGASACTS